MAERIYRDPVHNIIRLQTINEDRMLVDLIDAPEFQRLRRIKQLGMALYTYQGAEHSRFAHSIGALHLMTRVLDRLSESYRIELADRRAARAAALLHDVGHGPFSHVMEKVLGFHHEEWTVKTVLSEETEIGRVLRSHDRDLPGSVASIIEGRYNPGFIAQLVSSQLDVDRMDYLLRDSLMTGAKYGSYDLEWIINSLAIDNDTQRIYVAGRGILAVEAYLQARYYMFRQVYFHRTLRSAEAVLRSTISRALELLENGEEVWCAKGTASEKMLRKIPLNLQDHLELDDFDILFHIKQWQRSEDKLLRDLSRRFIGRRLFKAIDIDMAENQREEFVQAARKLVSDKGFDPKYYFVEDHAGDTPYFSYFESGGEPKNRIYVEHGFAQPKLVEISEVSEAVRGLKLGYHLYRICFPPEVKEEIYKLYHAGLSAS